jgi:hypothetical protein
MDRLLQIGFQVVGQWVLTDSELNLQLDKMKDESNLLYAFVVNGHVRYIGKTTQSLSSRMKGYLKPGPTQSTNIKNRKNILSALECGQDVKIFVLVDDGMRRYGSYHLNLAAGLEDDLIAKIIPDWNGRQGNKILALESDENVKSICESVEPSIVSVESHIDVSYKTLQLSEQKPESCFVLKLHKAYFNSGFFNVIVKYQHLFGGHNEEITIFCEEPLKNFKGYINRTANNNKTPRIMGGVALKRWFHDASVLDGEVLVEVLSKTSIRLKKIAS